MLFKYSVVVAFSFILLNPIILAQEPGHSKSGDKQNGPASGHPVLNSSDCTSGWKIFSQLPNNEGALPEPHVSYFRYQFKMPAGRKLKLKIEGEYPQGRYFGFNVYDAKNMNTTGGIADHEIEPDTGSSNPFRAVGEISSQKYTLNVVPVGDRGSKPNTLEMPQAGAQDEKLNEIWYRIYDPADGAGNTGKTRLPRITAFDAETGQLIDCPEETFREVPRGRKDGIAANLKKIKQIPPVADAQGKIHFVYQKGMGLYPNRDTSYLTARLPIGDKKEKIAVIRVKVPKTDLDYLQKRVPQAQVRYSPFCTGSAVSTVTTDCISDREAQQFVDNEGYLTVVIGPADFKDKVKNAAFLEYRDVGYPVVIYRHLLAKAEFQGNFTRLPVWPPKEGAPPEDYYADNPKNKLESYAPQVTLYREDKFPTQLK